MIPNHAMLALHIMAAGGIILKQGLITGNLIQEYQIGNTKIKIYDSSYIGKTKQDIESTLQRIAEIGRQEEHTPEVMFQPGL
jgi:hypothetical protein